MKRKQLKKLLATALTAAMVTSLAACGGGSNDDSSNSNSSTGGQSSGTDNSSTTTSSDTASDSGEEVGKYTVIKDKDGNPVDLGGMEIVLRDWYTDPDAAHGDTAYDEALWEYREWAQETYNFTFVQKAVSSWSSTPEDFVNYVTTGGDNENYLFILRPGTEYFSAMKNNLCWDLTEFDDVLDFSEAKWGCGTHEASTIKGAIYGMSAEFTEPKGGLYFNKRILNDAGINPDDLYKWQDNGEWTWEKFEEVCEQIHKDTDGDGVIDRNAMVSFGQELYKEAVYSNGGSFIGQNAEGLYYNALETPETLEALTWALDMRTKYEMKWPDDAQWDYFLSAFPNGEAAFLPEEAYRAGQDFGNMTDDFGFLCFPKGPKAQNYTNAVFNNPVVIPKCYDEDKAWKLAFAYNVWTEPVPGYEDEPVYRYTYLNAMRDTESVDSTIAILEENTMPNYAVLIPDISLGSDILWGISNDSTPAQRAEAIRDKWQAALDAANQ